ncbi:MAG: hypothetical protein KJZ79_13020 [Bryobacteraceae bacterium]|nr:hypothetical protein [Bryobacteraceae bacterium]
MTRREMIAAGLVAGSGSGFAQEAVAIVRGQVVDSFTGLGVAEARVILQRTDRGSFHPEGDFWSVPSEEASQASADRLAVVTGAGGRFEFVVEAPATVRLFASAEGYVRLVGGTGLMFALKPGDERASLVLKLHREGSISGRVIDIDTREPVAGLAVGALTRQAAPAGFPVLAYRRPALSGVAHTRTGQDGRYQLHGLASHEYYLQAAQPIRPTIEPPDLELDLREYRPVSFGPAWYPGVEEREQASRVHLSPQGQLDGVDFQVRRTPLYVVRGKLGEVSGEAEVAVHAVVGGGGWGGISLLSQAKLPSGSGFQIRGLRPGRYLLSLRAGAQYGEAPVEILDEHVDRVQLEAYPGARVTGFVRLKDASVPLSGGSPRVSMRRDLKTMEAAVAADGAFAFADVHPGEYTLQLLRAPKGFALAGTWVNGRLAPHHQVRIEPGLASHGIEVVLAPATAAVRVSVMDGLRPAPGAFAVLVREPVVPVVLRLPQQAMLFREADGEGEAEFSGLPAGKYRLAAFRGDSAWIDDPDLIPRLARAEEVALVEGEVRRVGVRVLG